MQKMNKDKNDEIIAVLSVFAWRGLSWTNIDLLSFLKEPSLNSDITDSVTFADSIKGDHPMK